MCSIARLSLILILSLGSCTRYLEFQLRRTPALDSRGDHQPITCKDEGKINQDAQYKEVCYEKDISYGMRFQREGRHYAMAADFTTPLSWLKGEHCTVENSSEKCKIIMETFRDKVKDIKKKVTSKFRKDTPQEENAVIEGSSQVIRGEIESSKNITFITKDSDRLSNFFQVIMLGLFFKDEQDHLQLESTNFISATSVSPNLNVLSDGAISLRLDASSQRSFLNEIFDYIKSEEKVVSVYLGQNKSLTIGDLTAKYTKEGFSGIHWTDPKQDEGYGLLADITSIGLEDVKDDNNEDFDEALPAIFSLSASYIGLPAEILTKVADSFKKVAKCVVNAQSFLECTANNKKSLEHLLQNHIYFTLSGGNIMIPLKELSISGKGNKAIFKLKKTFNNRAVLGEPAFKRYVVFFDYGKNKIGFAQQRQVLNEFLNVVALIRVICFIFVIGCSLLVCYKPCQKMMRTAREKLSGKGVGQEGLRLRQYAPIQENPYEDLKGKIQDVINSTDREFQS